MRRFAILAFLASAALTLAACGASRKMSASQTATWIEHHYGGGLKAKCEQATYWDYQCVLITAGTPQRTSHTSPGPRTAFFDVNSNRVTDSNFPVSS